MSKRRAIPERARKNRCFKNQLPVSNTKHDQEVDYYYEKMTGHSMALTTDIPKNNSSLFKVRNKDKGCFDYNKNCCSTLNKVINDVTQIPKADDHSTLTVEPAGPDDSGIPDYPFPHGVALRAIDSIAKRLYPESDVKFGNTLLTPIKKTDKTLSHFEQQLLLRSPQNERLMLTLPGAPQRLAEQEQSLLKRQRAAEIMRADTLFVDTNEVVTAMKSGLDRVNRMLRVLDKTKSSHNHAGQQGGPRCENADSDEGDEDKKDQLFRDMTSYIDAPYLGLASDYYTADKTNPYNYDLGVNANNFYFGSAPVDPATTMASCQREIEMLQSALAVMIRDLTASNEALLKARTNERGLMLQIEALSKELTNTGNAPQPKEPDVKSDAFTMGNESGMTKGVSEVAIMNNISEVQEERQQDDPFPFHVAITCRQAHHCDSSIDIQSLIYYLTSRFIQSFAIYYKSYPDWHRRNLFCSRSNDYTLLLEQHADANLAPPSKIDKGSEAGPVSFFALDYTSFQMASHITLLRELISQQDFLLMLRSPPLIPTAKAFLLQGASAQACYEVVSPPGNTNGGEFSPLGVLSSAYVVCFRVYHFSEIAAELQPNDLEHFLCLFWKKIQHCVSSYDGQLLYRSSSLSGLNGGRGNASGAALFHSSLAALLCASAMHKELLLENDAVRDADPESSAEQSENGGDAQSWPSTLARLSASETLMGDDGRPIWRGPQLMVGVAKGPISLFNTCPDDTTNTSYVTPHTLLSTPNDKEMLHIDARALPGDGSIVYNGHCLTKAAVLSYICPRGNSLATLEVLSDLSTLLPFPLDKSALAGKDLTNEDYQWCYAREITKKDIYDYICSAEKFGKVRLNGLSSQTLEGSRSSRIESIVESDSPSIRDNFKDIQNGLTFYLMLQKAKAESSTTVLDDHSINDSLSFANAQAKSLDIPIIELASRVSDILGVIQERESDRVSRTVSIDFDCFRFVPLTVSDVSKEQRSAMANEMSSLFTKEEDFNPLTIGTSPNIDFNFSFSGLFKNDMNQKRKSVVDIIESSTTGDKVNSTNNSFFSASMVAMAARKLSVTRSQHIRQASDEQKTFFVCIRLQRSVSHYNPFSLALYHSFNESHEKNDYVNFLSSNSSRLQLRYCSRYHQPQVVRSLMDRLPPLEGVLHTRLFGKEGEEDHLEVIFNSDDDTESFKFRGNETKYNRRQYFSSYNKYIQTREENDARHSLPWFSLLPTTEQLVEFAQVIAPFVHSAAVGSGSNDKTEKNASDNEMHFKKGPIKRLSSRFVPLTDAERFTRGALLPGSEARWGQLIRLAQTPDTTLEDLYLEAEAITRHWQLLSAVSAHCFHEALMPGPTPPPPVAPLHAAAVLMLRFDTMKAALSCLSTLASRIESAAIPTPINSLRFTACLSGISPSSPSLTGPSHYSYYGSTGLFQIYDPIRDAFVVLGPTLESLHRAAFISEALLAEASRDCTRLFLRRRREGITKKKMKKSWLLNSDTSESGEDDLSKNMKKERSQKKKNDIIKEKGGKLRLLHSTPPAIIVVQRRDFATYLSECTNREAKASFPLGWAVTPCDSGEGLLLIWPSRDRLTRKFMKRRRERYMNLLKSDDAVPSDAELLADIAAERSSMIHSWTPTGRGTAALLRLFIDSISTSGLVFALSQLTAMQLDIDADRTIRQELLQAIKDKEKQFCAYNEKEERDGNYKRLLDTKQSISETIEMLQWDAAAHNDGQASWWCQFHCEYMLNKLLQCADVY